MGSFKEIESDIKQEVICICGDSGSGKTQKASEYKEKYKDAVILDGDAILKYVNSDLGYSLLDRYKNNQVISRIAEMLYYQGHKVIISTVRADIAFEILTKDDIPCKLIKLSPKRE